jgi:hypothetical protein
MPRARRDERTPVDIPIEIIVEGGRRAFGRATNVSLLGARLETEVPLPFGTKVLLRMPLPGAVRPVFLSSVVRWTSSRAMGVQFGLLGVRETHLIAQLAIESAQVLGESDVAWVG